MIFPIRTFLVASLAANVVSGAVLVARHVSRSAAAAKSSGEAALAARSRAANTLAVASATSAPAQAAVPLSALEPSLDLKARLLAEGYPKEVVTSIIAVLVDQKYGVYELEAKLSKRRTPELQEQLKRQSELAKADMTTLTDLYQTVDDQRDRIYAVRYGDLPLATVEAIRKLENAHRYTTDRKFVGELQALLTPAQIDDYMRFNSMLAKPIQLTLDSIDVEESVYFELLNAAIVREKEAITDVDPRELNRRNTQAASAQLYRRVLGDERFLKIIARFDSVVASADAIYQVAGLSPAARADLFMEVYTLKERFQPPMRPGASRAEMAEAARATYQTILQKAALTPEQIVGFDLQLGAVLKRGEFGSSGGRGGNRGW